MVVSQNRVPQYTPPKYYKPNYRDAQKGTPNFGKPPIYSSQGFGATGPCTRGLLCVLDSCFEEQEFYDCIPTGTAAPLQDWLQAHKHYVGIMETNMETTTVYWGCIGIMEKKVDTTIVYWRYTERMENKMETAIVYILLKEGNSLKENNEDPRLSLPQESTLKP